MRREPRRAETALEDLADLFRVLMRDNRQLAPLADEIELCRQYLELEKLRLGERLIVEWHTENMPGTRSCRRWCCSRCSRMRSITASSRLARPGSIAINIFLRRGEVHAILRNPYKFDGGHHAGNKMAHRQHPRAAGACTSTPRRASRARLNRDSYEVHIRMPYRPSVEKADARW